MKSVLLGSNISIDYTYHISGAVASAVVKRADGSNLFNETLFYEDCGGDGCKPQYNGNISRMTHELVTQSRIPQTRDSRYYYDFMNRLTKVDDADMMFDEAIAYDDQGRITSLRRSAHAENATGGEYTYENRKNRLLNVAQGIGGGDFSFLGDAYKDVDRDMSDPANFDYDSEGNLIEDKSKRMKISYDWRGMPVEFKLQNTENSSDSTRLTMMYDGSGRRISKTRFTKAAGATDWETELVTHYTGIGTEVRDQFHNNILDKVKVVVNMPQGLGRYGVEEDSDSYVALGENNDPNAVFEWYLKNHLGSTMLVYGTQSVSQVGMADFGIEKAAYDYRAFGEQMSIVEPADKVTENFTGKELDDEIALNYFGARYLDPMLGLWISVDAARQYQNPYLYAGNNPIVQMDPDGNVSIPAILVGAAVVIFAVDMMDHLVNVKNGAQLLQDVTSANSISKDTQKNFYQNVGVNALEAVAGAEGAGAGSASAGAPTFAKFSETIRSFGSRVADAAVESAGDIKDIASGTWDAAKEKFPRLQEMEDKAMNFLAGDKAPTTQE